MINYLKRLWAAVCDKDLELEDVRAFHDKFKQLNYDEPGFLSRRKQLERAGFMQEELDEFLAAKTLADQADALIDLVYVAKGTAVMMGLPWCRLWEDVQRANMEKVPGTTHRGNLVDVAKPPGWRPPEGHKILLAYGWDLGDITWEELQPWALREDDVYREAV